MQVTWLLCAPLGCVVRGLIPFTTVLAALAAPLDTEPRRGSKPGTVKGECEEMPRVALFDQTNTQDAPKVPCFPPQAAKVERIKMFEDDPAL